MAAWLIGALVIICPFLASLAVFLDPLRRTSARGALLPVAPLDALPENGAPRRFPVIAARHDAWNKYPPEPIGAVYLRRVSEEPGVEAFNVICPHLGCPVGFNAERDIFQCPCHTSAFQLDGAVVSGPSPRGLDKLECEIRNDGGHERVWVKFENFHTGRTEKVEKT
jgi:menaquinol-cytochrome c reductase iron-sulfur subunit